MDRLGVGVVVVVHVDELLIRCFVIVDGEDLSFGGGATVLMRFGRPDVLVPRALG